MYDIIIIVMYSFILEFLNHESINDNFLTSAFVKHFVKQFQVCCIFMQRAKASSSVVKFSSVTVSHVGLVT